MRIAAIVGALVAVVLLVLFALTNRGQPIALDFGVWAWQGDAVYAIYAGVCVGLIVMFVVSLPSDLALRREHRRLRDCRVVETLGRPLETDLGELVAEHAVGLIEDRACGGGGLVHVAAHADGLRALPGEDECQCGHMKEA